jgi:hypothetical protein
MVTDNDFGIFVFSPDDQLKIRELNLSAVRDNVLFELGLFMGKKGRKRCFFITPTEQSFRVSSDLSGINTVKYDEHQAAVNATAALGPACAQIRRVLRQTDARDLDESTAAQRNDTSLEGVFEAFARFNVNHPLTLVRTTPIPEKKDVDVEIIAASDRSRELFFFRPGEKLPVGLHMDGIIERLKPFMDGHDLEAFMTDQRRISKAYSQGGHAVAQVPVKFNSTHPILPYKVFFPLAISYGGDPNRRDDSSLAVVIYLDMSFILSSEGSIS